jgi:hypothetical protein
MFLKKELGLLFTLIYLMIVFLEGMAFSDDKIVVRPKISVDSETDSNFYKAETEERNVYTFLVRPGILLGYETGKSSIILDYTLNAAYYRDKDDVPGGQKSADEDDYIGHTGILSLRSKPFERLSIGLEDAYYKTRDPAQADRFSSSVERKKYYINHFTPSVLYEFENRFSLGLGYRNTLTNYDLDNKDDSVENRGMFDLIYRFSRSAALDLEYQHWIRDYDQESYDYRSDQLSLIFKRQLKYVYLEGGCGYHQRSFDGNALEDQDVFSYRVAVKGQNPPIPVGRSIAYISRPKTYGSLSAERNFNDWGIGNRYFKTYQFCLNLGHVFMERILATLDAEYSINDYVTAEDKTASGERREDKTYGVSVGAGYVFKEMLTAKISGGYEERDSNFSGHSYENKYLMATIAFNYDLGMK